MPLRLLLFNIQASQYAFSADGFTMNVTLIAQFLFNLVFSGIIAAIVLLFLFVWQLFDYLKDRHPPIYRALGNPHLLFNNSPRINWLTLKFVFSDQAEATRDNELVKRTQALRWLLGFFGAGFVALLVVATLLAVLS